jgi:molybdopterin converting factor small subunit
MRNKIIFFGGLKDYFTDPIELPLTSKDTYSDVLKTLCDLNPEAKNLMLNSRFVSEDEFVEITDLIVLGAEICILPPASGG